MEKFERLQEMIQAQIFMMDDPKYLQRVLDECLVQRKLMETTRKWRKLLECGCEYDEVKGRMKYSKRCTA